MTVSSPVGNFPFRIARVSLRKNAVRLEGEMGAWPSQVEVTPSDLLDLAKVIGLGKIAAGAALVGAAVAIAGR